MTISTPAEFKQARHELGLSASQLGAILNTDSRTVRRWEAEETASGRPPNPIACRVLEWMLNGYRPPEWPSRGTAREATGHAADRAICKKCKELPA